MSQALRKLTGTISRSKTLVVFINQIRMKIGVMFGSPETTTGGNALKFYSSVRLDIRRIAAIKDGDNVIGNRTRVKVVKNKMAPPFKEVEFDILYGEGISKEGDLLDLATTYNVVEKSGTWFSYKDQRIGQGREQARNFLKEHPELIVQLRNETFAKAGMPNKAGSTSATATATEAKADMAKAEAKTEMKAEAKTERPLPAKHSAPAAKQAPAKHR
jgi:recombination protein RecA